MAQHHKHAVRSARLARLGRRLGVPTPKKWYRIIDPHAKPDLRNHFGGQPVTIQEGSMVVQFTDNQAKYYIDQGVIVPYTPGPSTKPQPKH